MLPSGGSAARSNLPLPDQLAQVRAEIKRLEGLEVDLRNELMAHPAVAEAAVIAIPDPKWQERPLAVVVLKAGRSATAEELRDFLAPHFVKWWLPDRIEFIDEIPKTAVGKFRKTALREEFAPVPVPAS